MIYLPKLDRLVGPPELGSAVLEYTPVAEYETWDCASMLCNLF